MNNELKKRCHAFVHFIIERIGNSKACLAALRRADNPTTEIQSWEYLAIFHVDLSKSYERLPYATISAMIAKSKIRTNGTAWIGHALARCYEDGNNNDQAKMKLRRLLACDSIEEVCRILRPLFSLIHAKGSLTLDFAQLLYDLLDFQGNSQSVKSSWAQNFYGHQPDIREVE